MSDTLRIALVAEGVTDYEVISAAIEAMLGDRSFVLQLLQPEGSLAFTSGGDAGSFGGGWKGVYRWCCQLLLRSQCLSDDPLFLNYDLFILHLDADVAGEDPANAKTDPIQELAGQLPCEQPCPPAKTTTNPLRKIMLAWVGESATPPNSILCTPSKNTETWIMAAFFPHDKDMNKRGWECHPNPEIRLSQQPKKTRFDKSQGEYAIRKPEFQAQWPALTERLTEAKRFQAEFMAAVVKF